MSKVKQALKDLTLGQVFEICDKYDTDESCRKRCPMREVCKLYLSLAIDRTKLESEIEVDE